MEFPTDLSRLLVVGDTHSNQTAWRFKHIKTAKDNDCQAILCVGDFGFWPGPKGDDYLHKIARDATAADLPILWLDGNHEWFDRLEEIGAFGADKPTRIYHHNIWYLPRGYTWEWSGIRCMSLGGAYSVDKRNRVPHKSWWPQEEITYDDVNRAISNRPADVMFTHDAPAGHMVPGVHAAWKQEYPAAEPNREKLAHVVDAVRPKLLIHGHYHVAYETVLHVPQTHRIIGLNMEIDRGSQLILDFPTLDYKMP